MLANNVLPQVTSTQMSVLQYMDKHDDEIITQKKLQDAFNLSKSTVSGIVQRLRQHKFIDMVPMPNDKRSNRIIFNPEFRSQMTNHDDYFKAQLDVMEQRLVWGMTSDEIDRYKYFLKRTLKNLNDHN